MRESEKFELRKVANDLSGLYGMTDAVLNDGRAKGVRAIFLKSDKGLECTVLADRCLDIPYLSYKGVNFSLTSKMGVSSPAYFLDDGGFMAFLRQFNCGSITTCGITHCGPPEVRDGVSYALHGLIGNTPGENVNKYEEVIDDEVVLTVEGEMRQAVHGMEYLVLHRKLQLFTEQNIIRITDVLENRGFSTHPVLMLYHMNAGYPVLDTGAKLYFSTTKIEPVDAFSASRIDAANIIEEPLTEGFGDEMFWRTESKTPEGIGMIHNEKLGLAQIVHYDTTTLPVFCQWKLPQAGNFSQAMEPSTAGNGGLANAKKHGWDVYIKPGEKMRFSVAIEVTDDAEKIAAYKRMCE